MVERVGNGVVSLRRTRFGSLELGELPKGEARRAVAARRCAALEGCRAGMSESNEPQDRVFALRGAVQADRNDRESILAATDELLREMIARNGLAPERMISCILTCTDDLDAEFPAVAARALGLDSTCPCSARGSSPCRGRWSA